MIDRFNPKKGIHEGIQSWFSGGKNREFSEESEDKPEMKARQQTFDRTTGGSPACF